jgi:signal transduction histidine kinase
VHADATALSQVFLNLLLNAAQACEPGDRAGIEIDRDAEMTTVVVWDTGRGIRPEDVDRVFDPFFTTRPDGTGLGMAIAQRIVRAHSGDIAVDSTVGIGTRVTVRLPLVARLIAQPVLRS